MQIEKIRHSLSHILAAVVLDMFPETKLAIGPAIETGFYYDFELPRTLIPEDLNILEEKMRQIINGDYVFEYRKEPKKAALEFLKKAGQPYKVELAKELKDEEIGFYDIKDSKTGKIIFVDMCAGPHVETTKDLKGIGFKLDKIAGAYWRGDEKNIMLQRIYGLAFATKAELISFMELRAEAEKRDHKKFGRELDLFSFHAEAPGMPFWHEKGMILFNIMEKFSKSIRKKYGYVEIKTPLLAKNTLWITSGHWDHYKDSMFSFELDKETYCLKPMDCPFNIKIYQTKSRSYKELPIRYTEIGRVYRHEKSGELNGLLRVQEITQDDSHIFLREEQIKQEISSLIKMVKEFYTAINLEPQFFLSTRPDDFIGEVKTWNQAEKDLKDALGSMEIKYDLKDKDGAFYGPKIDVDVKDALGRKWQVATIQLDFQLPGRFDCEYIDEKGERKIPVMIHAAVFGSFERMIGILLEHTAGLLPMWLSPVQVSVLPVSEKHLEYVRELTKKLEENNIRFEIDDRNESVGRKIRDAEMQKIPLIVVVGDREIETKSISVRTRGSRDLETMKVEELISKINI